MTTLVRPNAFDLGPKTWTAALLVCGLLSNVCGRSLSRAADWPRFRGPNGTGVSTDTGLPTEWSATKNILWKTELPGPGASSPITWDNRVFVTCYSGYGLSKTAPGNKADLKRHLLCIDDADGSIVWNAKMKASGHEREFSGFMAEHGYATHTPTVDESGVYAFYGATGAAKYSHDGELLWQRSCGTKSGNYGSAASPVLSAGLLIVNAHTESNAILGLNPRTGEIVWEQEYAPYHSTPVLAKANGREELVFLTSVSIDPANGNRRWYFEGPHPSLSSPVANGDLVYFGDHKRVLAIRLSGRGDETPVKVWESRSPANTAMPLYYKGHVYWVSEHGGIACCADAKTGELKYKQRLAPAAGKNWSSPVAADNKIYYVSLDKGTFVLAAGPEFRILAHNTIAADTGRWIATPAISNKRLILRSTQTLYCIGKSSTR